MLQIGVENMRAVFMDTDVVLVIIVVRIAADMVFGVNDQNFLAEILGNFPSHRRSGKPQPTIRFFMLCILNLPFFLTQTQSRQNFALQHLVFILSPFLFVLFPEQKRQLLDFNVFRLPQKFNVNVHQTLGDKAVDPLLIIAAPDDIVLNTAFQFAQDIKKPSAVTVKNVFDVTRIFIKYPSLDFLKTSSAVSAMAGYFSPIISTAASKSAAMCSLL